MAWHAPAGQTRHTERHALSSAVQEAGTQHGACGRGRSRKGFPRLPLFRWSVELMAGFPQELFLAYF